MEEERYWREYSKYKRELLMAEDDFRSLDCQVNKLKKVKKYLNVFHFGNTCLLVDFFLSLQNYF